MESAGAGGHEEHFKRFTALKSASYRRQINRKTKVKRRVKTAKAAVGLKQDGRCGAAGCQGDVYGL